MKKIFNSLLPVLLLLMCQSCMNEDDFLQEGTLRITFSIKSNVTNKTPITVEVIDFADNISNAKPIVIQNSVGKRPIEIKLNTGNYLIRTTIGANTVIKGVQIKKDKATEIEFCYFDDYPIESVLNNSYVVPIRQGKGVIETSILPISNDIFHTKKI